MRPVEPAGVAFFTSMSRDGAVNPEKNPDNPRKAITLEAVIIWLPIRIRTRPDNTTPIIAMRSCLVVLSAKTPPLRMPMAEHTKNVVRANVACVISMSYRSLIALIPKLCTPTSAAANRAKKQKQDRMVEENNKERFWVSEAELNTVVSMRTLEPTFESFKSLPKMTKNNTINSPRSPDNIKAVCQLKS